MFTHAPRNRSGALLALVFVLLSLVSASGSMAHGVGSSQLHLRVDGARLSGDWDVDLREVQLELRRLDWPADGDVDWGVDGQHA